jgi:hypothetical protein
MEEPYFKWRSLSQSMKLLSIRLYYNIFKFCYKSVLISISGLYNGKSLIMPTSVSGLEKFCFSRNII